MLVLLLSIVQSPDIAQRVDFDTEVMPVFTSAGCNTGACHGGAAGRGGFRLSLLGSRADADYRSIVKELEGRRVNVHDPADSLVLTKPTGLVDHGGDIPLAPLGEGAALLERWLEEGAERLEARRLASFSVSPASALATAVGDTVTLTATARFDDGSERDVTAWTVFSADSGAIELGDVPGSFVVNQPGQSLVLARYLTEVVAARVTTPLATDAVSIPASATKNVVDEHVNELLHLLRVPPAAVADDATFLRRVRLALTGTLPAPEEVEAFLAEARNQGAREQLVDRLIDSPEFVDYWTYRFGRMLRVRPVEGDSEVASAYQSWIRAQLDAHAPYDWMVRVLVLAEGDSHERGEAAFYRVGADPRAQAEFVSEAFLGARLRCANCHDHPLDRWTQDDYHGLAAVFAKLDTGRVVRRLEEGEVTHPATGAPAVPRLPGERFLLPERDGRPDFAVWLTRENDGFARNIVNRLWAALMGRGLVEPLDDLRATNPGSHPELLDALATDLAQHRFDVRRTIRLIATSATFERAVRRAGPSATDERYYASRLERTLEAEVLADAISAVTGIWDAYGEAPLGTRAIALADPSTPSVGLDLLGRCERNGPCESATGGRGLATKLHLVNGDLLNAKIAAEDGLLASWLARGTPNSEIVANLYLRALSRFPTDEERTFWHAELDAGPPDERTQRLEDFLWGLLSSDEFQTNH